MSLAVDNLKCMQADNIVQPVDAQIQDTGDCFEIIPEVTGNALDRTKTEEVIAGAMLRGWTSVNLEEESCYLKPSVYSTDTQLQANCEKMNQLCDIIITYDFADRTETVDRTVIKNWFGYDQDGNVILDENLVRQYVSNLGLIYDTMGQTRTFQTYDNREGEIKGGDYGWVIDQDAEVTALIEVRVTPQRGMGFDKVAERIYNYPEVNSVYLISGSFDFMVTIEGRTLREVSQFVSDKLSPLESVLSTKTNFILKKYKDHGTVMADQKMDERELMTP